MRKTAVCVLMIFVLGLATAGPLAAKKNPDLQAIKKAVKENPQYKADQEVKWFKVLVHDNRTNKDKVRITLPIALVEVFMKCAENKHLKVNCDDYDLDLKELFQELKKLGPMALIEIYEDEETVKIWLE